MRILHTADWHLGRIFHGVSLIEEQAHILDQMVTLAAERKVDCVIVAGDIFDRAVPPPTAVALLDDVWSRFVIDLKLPVFVIAGNHDSPERIELGARVVSRAGLHVAGTLRETASVTLDDAHGPVEFFLLPYAEPGRVRTAYGALPVPSGVGAVQHVDQPGRALAYQARRAAGLKQHRRSVCIAHGSVAGTSACESERPLSVGVGAACADTTFSPFSYTALGHHHRPQSITTKIRYPGSLFKYSFSEVADQKGVTIVDVDEDGTVRTDAIALSPRHDVRCLEGRFDDLLTSAEYDSARHDYLKVILTDDVRVLDPMSRLRERFDNLLEVTSSTLPTSMTETKIAQPQTATDAELFASFFAQVSNREMTADETRLFERVLQDVDAAGREASE